MLLVLVGFSIATYFFYKQGQDTNLSQNLDQEIANYSALVGKDVQGKDNPLSDVITLKEQSVQAGRLVYIQYDNNIVFSNMPSGFALSGRITSNTGTAKKQTLKPSLKTHKLAGLQQGKYVIVVGTNTESYDTNLSTLLYILIILNVSASVLSYFLGYKMVSHFIVPLEQFTKDITVFTNVQNAPKSLNKKYITGDEIQILSQTFDQLLQKIYLTIEREKEFMQDISHELRTPITAIKTTLELGQGDGTLSPDDISLLQTYSEKIEKLVNEFLFLGKTNSYNTIQSIDAYETIQTIQQSYQGIADKKKLKIHIQKEHNFTLKANTYLREMVVGNLVRNAISYTEKGTITLTIRNKEVSVTDTGKGITPDQQSKIWERLYRGDSSRSKE